MKPNYKNSKKKGRKFQNEIRDILIDKIGINKDNIKTAMMSESGEDIKLSKEARDKFPYSIETKNVESINIWKAIKQAKQNCNDHVPIVIFKRNYMDPHVVIPFDDFLDMVNKINKYENRG